MKNLYYVVIYHHSNNVKARVILTADNLEGARTEVLEVAAEGWKVEHAAFVCQTPTAVYLEV